MGRNLLKTPFCGRFMTSAPLWCCAMSE
jgi:hypothetical protein